jgi:peroxiredoxin
MVVPSITLPTTSGSAVDISKLSGLSILFCYPRSGSVEEKVPPEWDAIPGARGCTPQACSFRDNFPSLKQHGVTNLFGVSTQDTAYQQELRERVHLPYDLLSDKKLEMLQGLNLPSIEWEGKKLIKWLTVAVEAGKIVKWWYPIFPPDSNVDEVLDWLKQR